MSRSDDEKRGAKYIQLALEGGASVLRVTVEQVLRAMNLSWPSWYAENENKVKDLLGPATTDSYQFQNAMDCEEMIPATAKSDDGTPSLESLRVISLYRILVLLDQEEAQKDKIQKFFDALVELATMTDVALAEADFNDKCENLIDEVLMAILKTIKALKPREKEDYRARLCKITYPDISEISNPDVQNSIDEKQKMAVQMQQLNVGKDNNDNDSDRSDVNVVKIGTKVGDEASGKIYNVGDLNKETTDNLIALEKGLGPGSVNVKMIGGSVQNAKNFKIMNINESRKRGYSEATGREEGERKEKEVKK